MAIYREDGAILDVTVLEDTSDNEWKRYKLKINSVLKSSPIVNDPKIGEVFDCCQRKDSGFAFGMWDLEQEIVIEDDEHDKKIVTVKRNGKHIGKVSKFNNGFDKNGYPLPME